MVAIYLLSLTKLPRLHLLYTASCVLRADSDIATNSESFRTSARRCLAPTSRRLLAVARPEHDGERPLTGAVDVPSAKAFLQNDVEGGLLHAALASVHRSCELYFLFLVGDLKDTNTKTLPT